MAEAAEAHHARGDRRGGGGRRSRRGGNQGGGSGSSKSNNKRMAGRKGGRAAGGKRTEGSGSALVDGDAGEAPGRRKMMVLHGNRQTGELILGRMSSLKRKLLKPREGTDDAGRLAMEAPDAPFLWEPADGDEERSSDDLKDETHLRTWWHRNGDEYRGLEMSLDSLHRMWIEGGGFDGILGFSQGARMAHLVSLLHTASGRVLFPGLRFVVLASGYGDVPLPSNFPPRGSPWDEALSVCRVPFEKVQVEIPSLHVMGAEDKLIPVQQSSALLGSYRYHQVYEHKGGHHVPMRAADIQVYLEFIDSSILASSDNATPELLVSAFEASDGDSTLKAAREDRQYLEIKQKPSIEGSETIVQKLTTAESLRQPDEEHAQVQADESESLSLIFPEEFRLLSKTAEGEDKDEFGGEHKRYVHPICYAIDLRPPDDQIVDRDLWPVGDIALQVRYTADYPDVLPEFSLRHDMNLLQFKVGQSRACLGAVRAAAESEAGMPCVMTCVYAARDFFENGGLAASASVEANEQSGEAETGVADEGADEPDEHATSDQGVVGPGGLARSSPERIQECNRQGLQIAARVLGHPHSEADTPSRTKQEVPGSDSDTMNGKGGSWKYTIGLVGKPSAGKSTFFNAASAFARQRGGPDSDGTLIGGATMAPHPFTTIDPNVGYCLVPAPPGSCPEDDRDVSLSDMVIGSTHGRDSSKRRLLPVMLKDVAGLVPGAYQGRGKGNKFLDDLTDADVLIHVMDASGTADAEGNKICVEGDKKSSGDGSTIHPLTDLAWVRNELVEWVYFNLSSKWDGIKRRGREKLVGMFSGYKQSQSFVWDVLFSIEKYLEEHEGRRNALDNLCSWDEGDLHRLVSAFLGVRFPMALALNKSDLPSATVYTDEIKAALPIHGAHVGVSMSARQEMNYVKAHITGETHPSRSGDSSSGPCGVWDCLQAAMRLREPVLVFPVSDMKTYQPLPGMTKSAVGDSSLPNAGMISCLEACGGSAPTLWDGERRLYTADCVKQPTALRDALMMKPGSCVDDVFSTLKKMGVVSGEFVRAEGVGNTNEHPKLLKKDDLIGRNNRIIKIMTNRKS